MEEQMQSFKQLNTTMDQINQEIYADYNGSAPLDCEVKKYLVERIQNGCYSNPNASHKLGLSCEMTMEKSRRRCAKVLGCKPKNIVFNSGSTEGISTVFHSVLNQCESSKNLIILSGIEHSAIYNNAQKYVSKGFEIKIIPTLENGIVDFNVLQDWLINDANRCALISVMAANNETGVVQPYKEIAKLCCDNTIPFFSDTTQFIGKEEFNFDESGIDFAVVSGHKFGALTGTGMILAKDTSSLIPLIIGGGQEKGLRGGTQNYIGYETLPIALESFISKLEKISSLSNKRIEFENKIKQKFSKVIIFGEDAPRVATTTYLSYPGMNGKEIQKMLQDKNIYVTTSSACSDSKSSLSRVLRSMGVSEVDGQGVIRISLGLSSPLEYYDHIYNVLSEVYESILNKEIQ